MNHEPKKECFKTSVGGQALMEGIMMRGPKLICCAVRKPDGTIEDVYKRQGQNMVTKHVKPRRQGEQGGIVKAEGAMYASKVMPICPKCGKAVRVGHVEKDGKMVRVCKKCGAEL